MKLPPNYQYILMDYDDRETLYQQWCLEKSIDPAVESSVEDFFAAIDRIEDLVE